MTDNTPTDASCSLSDEDIEACAMNIVHQIGETFYGRHVDIDLRQSTNDKLIDFSVARIKAMLKAATEDK